MDVLTVQQMYAADQAAVSGGISSLDLMEAAGAAVADAILSRFDKRPVCVLAGPGNNGGDGFVVARLLKNADWPVTVYLLGEKADLDGDAAVNAKRWRSKVQPLDAALDVIASVESSENLLVVDALFGAGLSRPLDGSAKILAELITVSQAQGTSPIVVSVDIPSGLDGNTGRTHSGNGSGRRGGICFHADLTVTFCRPKPGHVLYPGCGVCGDIVVADIGIPDDIVDTIASHTTLNDEDLWLSAFPNLSADIHKYARGHVVVLGGDIMCGAARLVSAAARRGGAGVVGIASTEHAFPLYAIATSPGTLVHPFRGLKSFKKLLEDPRMNTCVLGPGAGVCKATRDKVMAALGAGKHCVLDADALTVFETNPKALFKAAKAHAKDKGGSESIVLTPHGGEFPRLFPDLSKKYSRAKASKIDVTIEAAKRSGCVVLLKGPDTVVASPDGRAAITVNAPPWLATAGAGDVLSGLIGAFLAQGMPAFEAANAAAWVHGEAANAFGPGLIAEDIIDEIPGVLDGLMDHLEKSV